MQAGMQASWQTQGRQAGRQTKRWADRQTGKKASEQAGNACSCDCVCDAHARLHHASTTSHRASSHFPPHTAFRQTLPPHLLLLKPAAFPPRAHVVLSRRPQASLARLPPH
eukprot:364444-Chlamydomonas_euryale.AAC.17